MSKHAELTYAVFLEVRELQGSQTSEVTFKITHGRWCCGQMAPDFGNDTTQQATYDQCCTVTMDLSCIVSEILSRITVFAEISRSRDLNMPQ